MLNIRQVKHLARHLGVTVPVLERLAQSTHRYCEELELLDPAKPEKRRIVMKVTGLLRRVQDRMLKGVLLPKLRPSPYSHGSVAGRSIKTNVEAHTQSAFGFVTDISNCFPSITRWRVYRLFVQRLGCTPDVARICTKLCTYDHHLALGLPTSPILADQLLSPVDWRIAIACAKLGLVYTRFVDDLALSGTFNLATDQCGIAALVVRILSEHGFHVNPTKHRFGAIADDFAITKIRIKNGHLDVRREYFEELQRQLDDVASLARGGPFAGPYYTAGQIGGRVRFVCWINKGRTRRLVSRFRSIAWGDVEAEARRRCLIATRKTLRSVPASEVVEVQLELQPAGK